MSDKEHQLSLLIKTAGACLDPERTEQILHSFQNIATELEKLRSLDLHDVHPAVVFSPEDMTTGEKNEL